MRGGSWCGHCNRPAQTSDHYDDKTCRLEALCTPCWQVATQWDVIALGAVPSGEKAA